MEKETKKCEKCYAHYTGKHKCDGFMKMLVAMHKSADYSVIDHTHCFLVENPPCGQKIKHFECCLCKELHPDIIKTHDRKRNSHHKKEDK